ncbi:MAG TPA: energy transducer TonB [Thermodesulfobacteriota bacterium]|nr:energy transducer TonB [Thermodesulfobacteriota bacterium]
MLKQKNINKFVVISVLAHFVLLSVLALIFRSEAKVAISSFFEVSTVKVASKSSNTQNNTESRKPVTSRAKTSITKKPISIKNKSRTKKETNQIKASPTEVRIEQTSEADNKIAKKIKSSSKENNYQQVNIESINEDAYPDYSANPKPPYPLIARRRGYEGTVLLKVLVLEDGKVGKVDIEKSSAFRVLDLAAINAVNKWNFIPGKQNGVQFASWVKVPVKFRLKDY